MEDPRPAVSDTERPEQAPPADEGWAEDGPVDQRLDAESIRTEIETAREATERLRAKANALVEELRLREAKARDAAARARLAAKNTREHAHRAVRGYEHAQQRALARAKQIVKEARRRAADAEERIERLRAQLNDAEQRAIAADDRAEAAAQERIRSLADVQLPEPAAPGDPSGTRYVGGRRLRTF